MTKNQLTKNQVSTSQTNTKDEIRSQHRTILYTTSQSKKHTMTTKFETILEQ